MHGCQMRFVKIPAILLTAPDLSRVVIRKQQWENRHNPYCEATINNLPVLGVIGYISVCVWRDNRTKDYVSSSK